MSAFALIALGCILFVAYLMRPRHTHIVMLPRPLAAIMYRKGDGICVHGKRCRVVSVDYAGNSLMVRET